MDHWWAVAVQVDQTPDHVSQNGSLHGEGNIRVVFQQLIKAGQKTFHNQHRQGGVGKKTHS